MEHALFVYGTLMIPEIREALLKRTLKSKDAISKGYSANTIIYGQYQTEYPFLKPCSTGEVKGQVLYPVDGLEMDLIKFYEGSEYVLSTIAVLIEGKEVLVPTFVLRQGMKVEYGPQWNQDAFIKNYLNSYMDEIIPQVIRNYSL